MYGNGVINLKKGVHDEGEQMCKSVATVGLVQCVDQVFRGKRRFEISNVSEELSRSVLYTIVQI